MSHSKLYSSSGVHAKTGGKCDPAEAAGTIRRDLERAKDFLFPANLPLTEDFSLHDQQVNGGSAGGFRQDDEDLAAVSSAFWKRKAPE